MRRGKLGPHQRHKKLSHSGAWLNDFVVAMVFNGEVLALIATFELPRYRTSGRPAAACPAENLLLLAAKPSELLAGGAPGRQTLRRARPGPWGGGGPYGGRRRPLEPRAEAASDLNIPTAAKPREPRWGASYDQIEAPPRATAVATVPPPGSSSSQSGLMHAGLHACSRSRMMSSRP